MAGFRHDAVDSKEKGRRSVNQCVSKLVNYCRAGLGGLGVKRGEGSGKREEGRGKKEGAMMARLQGHALRAHPRE
jgi:hypothetical protein